MIKYESVTLIFMCWVTKDQINHINDYTGVETEYDALNQQETDFQRIF